VPSSLHGDKCKVYRKLCVTAGLGLILLVALCIFATPIALAVEAENSWATMKSMPGPRGALGAVTLNGKVYAIGGFCQLADMNATVRNNEVYNPASGNWTKAQAMPTARYWFGIAAANNQIFCIGGLQSNNITGANEVFNPDTNMWRTKASLPAPRYQLCAYAVDGKIYALGGVNASGVTGINQVYDPATDTWADKASIPTPVANFSSALLDNKIYIIGGSTASGDVGLTQIYDPAKNTWSHGEDLPVPMSGASAATTTGYFATKGIYVFGSQSTWFFSQEMNGWILAAKMATARQGASTAVVDDLMYVLGGFESLSNAASYSANEQFTPYGYGTGPPIAFICSPQNSRNYSSSNILLQFTLNKEAVALSYSLDGKEKVAITGNTTLTGLSSAEHSIVIYASDGKGNVGTSQTVTFHVNLEKTSVPSDVNLTLAGAIVAFAVVGCAGLLLYFATRRRKAGRIGFSEKPQNVNYCTVNY
jgi:N-acetylneuraminic acid mutarotase